MALTANQASRLRSGNGGGPAIIAHGGGNSSDRATGALGTDADFLEVDLWLRKGGFEVRHERRLISPLPVLFEKWYLKFAPLRPFELVHLLEAADGKAGILLDLKNGPPDIAADLVRRSIDYAAADLPLVASSQNWAVLREVAIRCREVDILYSVDGFAQLDLLLSLAETDPVPLGVSCRHSLLDEDMITALHDCGLVVVAWTVDDLDRAADLAAWGVDGITTHRPTEIRERLGAS